MNVAIIPARGGSKRIPRKNIKDFCGKPVIAYSIEAAEASEVFDRIIVSTDDSEIADVAKKHGAEIPFMRPKYLSDDHTGTTEVIAHAVEWMRDEGWTLSAVCCIYATAPFIQAKDLQIGRELLRTGNWQFVFSATTFPFPIHRAFEQTSEGGLKMVFPEYFSARSQDLPVAIHDAGQFYWGLPDAWAERRKIFDKWSTVVLLPRWRVQDIDTMEDWEQAEILFSIIEKRLSLLP